VQFLLNSSLKDSDPARVLLAASQLYVDDRKYEEAEKLIKQGLEKMPDDENLQFQLGAVYERQEKYGAAEASFRKVLAKNPTHDGVLNYLGYMFADRGVRLEEALGYLRQAVELSPYNGAYLDSLGWVYFKLKQYDQAEIHLKQAVELIKDDPTILEHLGDLYRKLDRFGEAGLYYEKSVASSKEPEERKRVQNKLTSVKKLLSERRQ
jgi:tetratricopeptide (TPR) repeat protein